MTGHHRRRDPRLAQEEFELVGPHVREPDGPREAGVDEILQRAVGGQHGRPAKGVRDVEHVAVPPREFCAAERRARCRFDSGRRVCRRIPLAHEL